MGLMNNVQATNTALGAIAQQQRNAQAAEQARQVAQQAGDTNALLGMLLDAQAETNRLLMYLADLEHRRELRELTKVAVGDSPESRASQ